MKNFKRGLRDKVVIDGVIEFLNLDLGKKILRDETIQICIRNNYINIYKNGCSILKFNPRATKNKYLIHNAYFGIIKSGNSDYTNLTDDNNDLITPCGQSFAKKILSGQSEEFKIYVNEDGEKSSISKYVQANNPFLIDLEVGYARERTKEEREGKKRAFVADRIDMAILDNDLIDGSPILRFVEVKLDTDDRLKSDDGKRRPGEVRLPEILTQMSRYKKFILSQKEHIIDSYSTIAQNYIDMGIASRLGNCGKYGATEALELFIEKVKNVPSKALDLNPHLLILKKDPYKDGMGEHINRLNQLFANDYPSPEMWPACDPK